VFEGNSLLNRQIFTGYKSVNSLFSVNIDTLVFYNISILDIDLRRQKETDNGSNSRSLLSYGLDGLSGIFGKKVKNSKWGMTLAITACFVLPLLLIVALVFVASLLSI